MPLSVSDEMRAGIAGGLPELPAAVRARFADAGVEESAARTIVTSGLAGLLDDAITAGADAAPAAKWLTGEVVAHLNRTGADAGSLEMDGAGLAGLVAMVDSGDLSATAAKEVLKVLLEEGGEARTVAESRDLLQVSDEGALGAAVDEVLAAHPDEVQRVAGGEDKLVGFLVGQVMRASGGKADPRVVDRLIRERAGA